jgi:hypothetical protein
MSARKTVRPWLSRHFILAASAWLLLTLPPGTAAAAPNKEAVANVVRLNKEARQFFDAMEFTLAEKSLRKAIEIGEAASLGSHVVMAGTYGNLAILYTTGIKDEAQALLNFKKALELRPEYVPSQEMNSPEVKELFERARSELQPAETTPAPETTEPSGSSGGQLRCPAPESAGAGSSLKLRCVAEGELAAAEVLVYFHAGDSTPFRSRKMSSESSLDGSARSWATQLPADATSEEKLYLYFQARNKQGEVASSVGSAEDPTVVGIVAKDERPKAAGGRRARGGEGEDEGGAAGADSGFWWIGLGLGSGYGYAGKSGPEGYHRYLVPNDYKPGMAPAPLGQASPEVGYFLTSSLSLSLQGRFQYLPRTSSKTANGAIAFLARLLYFTNGETVRFYGGPILGGGNGFRLQVRNIDTTITAKPVSDTVRGGPFIFGAGGGIAVGISDSWSLIGELNFLAGAPDFSVVVDLNLGVRVRL